MKTNNDINSRAMLVSLNVSTFNPTRLDRAVTAEVTSSKNASKDAGNFKRQVIPKELIDPVNKAANAAYLNHKRLTCAWEDGGTRLLCIDAFDLYNDTINGDIRQFEIEVGKFLREYETVRAQAPVRMGALFNPKDYPPLAEVRERFAIRTQWAPLPNGSDFRVHLQDTDLAELASSVDQRVTEAVAKAREDLHERLHDRLSKVSERLSKPDNIFRDSLIENLKDLCTLIPKMCLTPDPELLRAVDQATLDIVSCAPDDLRNDDDKRAKAKAAADAILRTMGGMLTPNVNQNAA
jgi:hypothetical protein